MNTITEQDWKDLFPIGRSGGPAQVTDIYQVISELDEKGYFIKASEVGDLKSDGTIKMENTFIPNTDFDLVTKKYVDDNINNIQTGEIVKKSLGYVVKDFNLPENTGEYSFTFARADVYGGYGTSWQGQGATGDGAIAFNGWLEPGYYTTTSGWVGTTASGRCSFSLGGSNGYYSSGPTTASGDNAIAVGSGVKASGDHSQAFGYETIASGKSAHAEGQYVIASGYSSHAEGRHTEATGECSHAEGLGTTARGDKAHAEGSGTYSAQSTIYNVSSTDRLAKIITLEETPTTRILAGELIIAYHPISHGFYEMVVTQNVPTGEKTIHVNYVAFFLERGSKIFHLQNSVSGTYYGGTHAEGLQSGSFGNATHAEGFKTLAVGMGAHAEGIGTTMLNDGGHACGKYNTGELTNTILEVGIGQDSSNKKNGLEVYLDGVVTAPEASPDIVASADPQTLVPLSYLFSSEFGNALPTTDPGIPGQLWNDAGTVKISQ